MTEPKDTAEPRDLDKKLVVTVIRDYARSQKEKLEKVNVRLEMNASAINNLDERLKTMTRMLSSLSDRLAENENSTEDNSGQILELECNIGDLRDRLAEAAVLGMPELAAYTMEENPLDDDTPTETSDTLSGEQAAKIIAEEKPKETPKETKDKEVKEIKNTSSIPSIQDIHSGKPFRADNVETFSNLCGRFVQHRHCYFSETSRGYIKSDDRNFCVCKTNAMFNKSVSGWTTCPDYIGDYPAVDSVKDKSTNQWINYKDVPQIAPTILANASPTLFKTFHEELDTQDTTTGTAHLLKNTSVQYPKKYNLMVVDMVKGKIDEYPITMEEKSHDEGGF